MNSLRKGDDKIAQEEILNFLERIKKPVSRGEIAEELKLNRCYISHSLKKLLIHNEIKCIEINRIQAQVYFKDKAPTRRMRLYYVDSK